ncbi:hypothetical protein BKA70DRAFT_114975 [Coprinopsis sp. MPI-PUGE-AT-0042]|nr:hypothetical protein BKA70DRAFT_114975 [Coprinopsis sp. MPI-PUGE-AT-0042]
MWTDSKRVSLTLRETFALPRTRFCMTTERVLFLSQHQKDISHTPSITHLLLIIVVYSSSCLLPLIPYVSVCFRPHRLTAYERARRVQRELPFFGFCCSSVLSASNLILSFILASILSLSRQARSAYRISCVLGVTES